MFFYCPLPVSEPKKLVEKSLSVGLAIHWLIFGGVSECFVVSRGERCKMAKRALLGQLKGKFKFCEQKDGAVDKMRVACVICSK